jgi:hypothetical protein
MTPLIIQALVAAGRSPATSIILKATATSAMALLIARLTRKRRASLHHVVFVAAFVTLLIIPIATIVLPTVAVPLAVSGEEGQLFGRMSAVGAGSTIERKQPFMKSTHPSTSVCRSPGMQGCSWCGAQQH